MDLKNEASRREFLKIMSGIGISIGGSNVSLAHLLPDDVSWMDRIKADPENDSLRLGYADWLLEHSNNLGELIRIQVKLEGCSDIDPQWYALAYQEPTIQHGTNFVDSAIVGRGNFWKWQEDLSEFKQPSGRPIGLGHFHRGLVEEFSVFNIDELVAKQDYLIAAAPLLCKLDFSSERFGNLIELKKVRWLPNIRSLKFYDCNLTGQAMEALAQLPLENLCSLEIESCRLGQEGLSALGRSKYLRKLSQFTLSGCTYSESKSDDAIDTSPTLSEFFQSPVCQGLRKIEIASNMSSENLDALQNTSWHKKLESIAVYGNQTQDDWFRFFNTSLPNLKQIDIRGGCGEYPFPTKCLRLQSPTHLTLISNKLADVDIEELMQGSNNLLRLDLDNNQIADAAVAVISRSDGARNLRYLNLSSNPIGVNGAKAIAASTTLNSLLALMLSCTQIGDEGICAIANSNIANELRFLGVWNAGATSRSAIAVANSPHLKNLVWLTFRDSQIDDEGVAALADSPYLNNIVALSVQDCPYSEESFERLQDRFGEEAVDNYYLGYLI